MSSAARIFATELENVVCRSAGVTQIVHFKEGSPRGNVSCAEPFTAPGRHCFEVWMKDKKRKTAVGFLSERKTTEYMRDTPIGETFLSMGGAGWIHPHETAARKKYGEGDRVRVEANFDEKKVKFFVNSDFAGEADWDCDKAFPAISSDGGNCELEVTFPEN